jgi:alkanesulfonate monooxygenase SsuD/methylene tetrahydromethanopterin reductase-like flavin-dependent oxidoreductase (luciferase family)
MPNGKIAFSLGGAAGMSFEGLVEACQVTERLGFDGYYVSDHFTPHQPIGLTSDMLEAMTVLGNMAAHTSTIKLGTMVSPIMFRHPVLLAKCITTLDHVSGGRAMLGIGTAVEDMHEYTAYGIDHPPYEERVARVEETLAIMHELFKNERTNFEGKYFTLKDAPFDPKPIQKPHPYILVAGGSMQIMRVAAKWADDWNYFGLPSEMATKNKELDEVCQELGRDPATLQRSRQIQVLMTDDKATLRAFIERQATVLPTMYKRLGRIAERDGNESMVKDYHLVGTVAEVKEKLHEWADTGVTHLSFPWPRPVNVPMLEQFAAEVMPEFA